MKKKLFLDIEGGYRGSSNSLFQMVTALKNYVYFFNKCDL